ncbi:MAG TPA: hypothetical protein VH684_04780 [Xanthobacteraceae bacterium]|jgi:hypothetical protein
MIFKPVSSGNPAADLYIARRRVNDAFLRDLIAHWQKNGPEILEKVGSEQPGTYMKVMAMLMPKEMKVETTPSTLSKLSDEQLRAMIVELEQKIADRLNGESAKVINGQAEALPSPDQPAGGSWKRNPKSSPERLARARQYMRKRRAAEKAAKQAETQKTDTAPSTPPA